MSFTLIHQAANKIVKKYTFTEYDDLDTFFKGLCVKYPYNDYDFSGVRQGVYTLSFPMKELKADLVANRVIYNNNPIDKWCLQNMEVKTDINNNIQPVKGIDNRKRIDGGVSLIIGYVVLLDKRGEYETMI